MKGVAMQLCSSLAQGGTQEIKAQLAPKSKEVIVLAHCVALEAHGLVPSRQPSRMEGLSLPQLALCSPGDFHCRGRGKLTNGFALGKAVSFLDHLFSGCMNPSFLGCIIFS